MLSEMTTFSHCTIPLIGMLTFYPLSTTFFNISNRKIIKDNEYSHSDYLTYWGHFRKAQY